jgi:mannitol/fructose-specific phosphotransferase system IIA component (Ntr-type)
MKNKPNQTLFENIESECDYHDSTEYIIIAVRRKSNEVWHSHQGNPMHLLQVLETSADSIKKEAMKTILSKLADLIDDEEDDDPHKMELAKAEAEKALKNITKH